MNKNIGFQLYEALFHSETPISALQAWSLIEDALINTHNRAIKIAADTAIHWTDGKERDDYDTFSAASAINGEIQTLKVSIE